MWGEALPRRSRKKEEWGFAPRTASGPEPRAEPEPGAQPLSLFERDGEAEPRLTSGGGAATFGLR